MGESVGELLLAFVVAESACKVSKVETLWPYLRMSVCGLMGQ